MDSNSKFYNIFRKFPHIALLLNIKSYKIENVNEKFEKVVMDKKLALNLYFPNDFLQACDRIKFKHVVEDMNEMDDIEVVFKTLTKKSISQRI
jgi:hypothetical protein